MTPERWAQIEELFHRAAECAPERRAVLLDEVCRDDLDLRRDVEALLSYDGSAGDPLQAAVHSELKAVGFPLTGETVSHYRVLEGIGGGMGLVYRAEDLKLGRQVALKFLPEESAKDPAALARFEREARSASALEHSNICPIYEFGEHEGQPFLVMPLLEGTTLRELISPEGVAEPPLPLDKLLDLAIQVAGGLEAAHLHGIVHRDIKPANIFVTTRGQAKILDFGLAKLQNSKTAEAPAQPIEEHPQKGEWNSHLTRTGAAMGTAGYMSPEQARGEKLDARSDLFSFGLVLYEMATGQRAFKGEAGPVPHDAILGSMPTPARQLNPQLPAKLEKIIQRALEKDCEARYQSASEMRADLERLRRRIQPLPGGRLVRALGLGAIGAVLLATILFAFRGTGLRQRFLPKATPHTLHSLAVLPLENLSGDPSQEYFADGMTDALTTDLTRISSLKVVSRTSAMQYKGSKKSLPEIARELGVDGIVEGTVQRAGNRVRITAQLIQGATDRHLWANSYERNLEDVLSLQGEIARTIAGEISVKLTPQEEAGFAQRRPVNLKAMEAYLQGRYHYEQAKSLHFYFGVEKTREAELNQAIGYLQQAVAEDPSFVPGYVEMGEVWAMPEGWYEVPWNEAKAREAFGKALAIDPTLAEAHADLGRIEMRNWNWAVAEQQFKQAIELNPNLSKAHEFYSEYLDAVGRHDEGMKEAERAQELDPTSDRMAWEFYIHRQFDRFIELRRIDITRYGFGPRAQFDVGFAYELEGKQKEAVEEWEGSMTEFGYKGLAADLRRGYAAGGFTGAMRAWAAGWEQLSRRGEKVQPEVLAYIYETLEENDRALAYLGKACQERRWIIPYLKTDPTWDRLRGDPRFADLIRRIGLTPRDKPTPGMRQTPSGVPGRIRVSGAWGTAQFPPRALVPAAHAPSRSRSETAPVAAITADRENALATALGCQNCTILVQQGRFQSALSLIPRALTWPGAPPNMSGGLREQ